MACEHEDFEVDAKVIRLSDSGRFTMDVRVKCTQCEHPFRFLGLPMGVDLNGATTSADGTEGRFSIHPKGVPVPPIPAHLPQGYTVRKEGE